MEEYIRVGRWFSVLHRQAQSFIAEASETYGLTYLEYVLLIALFDNEGTRQDALGDMISFDKAVVTRTVNLLVEKGYIVRRRDEADRRVRHLYLTEKARAEEQYLRNILYVWMECLLEGMDKNTLDVMMEGFRSLIDRVGKADFRSLLSKINHEEWKGENRLGKQE